MASYLGVDEVAGQVVLRGLGLLTFMIPVSIMFGTAIIVGNSLGEGRASVAMQYYRHAVFLGFLTTGIQIFFFTTCKDSIIAGFTNQEIATEIVNRAWPVFLVFTFFDTVQLSTSRGGSRIGK